jgi:type VI secretion system secreted protein VgrG
MLQRSRVLPLVVVSTAMLAVAWPLAAFAATTPRLGTALNFTVLAGSTITNTGPTVISGSLGLDPGSAVTGFPPGSVTGSKHISDAVALQAKRGLITAYNDAANSPTTSDLTGKNLGGKNLKPGVYKFSSSAQLTGTLTLNGNGVYIFKIGSTLTTASNSVVRLTGGAQACAVFWQVGSSATLGTTSQLQGNLMALTSITMTTGANIRSGRAMARGGALTLDDNRITPPTGVCTASSTTTTTTTAGVPDTGAANSPVHGLGIVMLIGGATAVAVGIRRRRSPSHI